MSSSSFATGTTLPRSARARQSRGTPLAARAGRQAVQQRVNLQSQRTRLAELGQQLTTYSAGLGPDASASPLALVISGLKEVEQSLATLEGRHEAELESEEGSSSSSSSDSSSGSEAEETEGEREERQAQMLAAKQLKRERKEAAKAEKRRLKAARKALEAAAAAQGIPVGDPALASSNNVVPLHTPGGSPRLSPGRQSADVYAGPPGAGPGGLAALERTQSAPLPPVPAWGATRVEVCQGKACSRAGARSLLQAIEADYADTEALVTPCKCLGECKKGPNVRVRREGAPGKGTVFTGVRAEGAMARLQTAPVPAVPVVPTPAR